MDAVVARKTWRTLEPLHALVYFAPEAQAAYEKLGLTRTARTGYFASRSSPMGAVTADVVVATFFNFEPGVVRAAMDGAWEQARPELVTAARVAVAGAALRRLLGDAVDGAEMAEAAALARTAAEAATTAGRPLFAGHAALPWPEEPHQVLWHAVTLLREFRGDGHVAVLVAEEVDACEALVLHAAMGEVPAAALQATRGWSDEDWAGAVERLGTRGWVDAAGSFTDDGRAGREQIECRTDELARTAWEAIGEGGCQRLREVARPSSRAIVDSGEQLRGGAFRQQ